MTLRPLINITTASLLFMAVALLFVFTPQALAQNPFDEIEYPIAELGDCGSRQECKTYCDEDGNLNQCLDFAEKKGLLAKEEIRKARKFADSGSVGPGECRGKSECQAYCEDVNNIDQCLEFAESHDLVQGEELAEMRKISKALKEGVALPGGCKNKNQCQTYCESPDNIDECLAFAEKADFISPKELEEAKNFADLMRRGETPGGCRGERVCRAYCENPDNREVCFEFAVKAGVVSQEEAERFRKTGGRGPGGCASEAECRSFCENPKNTKACFEFGKEHGIVNDERFERARSGSDKLRQTLDGAPESVISCVDKRFGSDFIDDIMAGNVIPSPDIARDMGQCFREGFENFNGQRFEGRDDADEFDEENDFSDRRGGKDFNNRDRRFAPVLPPKVGECVKTKIGNIEAVFSGSPSGEMESVVKRCFEDVGLDGFPVDGVGSSGNFREKFESGKGSSFPEGLPERTEFKEVFPEDGHQKKFNERLKEEFNQQIKKDFQGEFDKPFQEEFQRQSREIEKRFREGLERRDFPAPEGVAPGGVIERRTPSPADFSPEHKASPGAFSPESFKRQRASPLLFILNR